MLGGFDELLDPVALACVEGIGADLVGIQSSEHHVFIFPIDYGRQDAEDD